MNPANLFKQFSKQKILVVGDVMLDAYLWGNVERISPEAPVPVVAIERTEERLGGAANVALNLKELGSKPLLCSVIGNDETGKLLVKILKRNKISTEGIVTSSSRTTSVKTRVISKSHQLIRFDSEMTSDLNKDDEEQLYSRIENIIKKENPAALIFEDYNKGILTQKLIHKVITLCRERKIFIAVDPKKKNFFSYQNSDLFKPNLREVREALHQDLHTMNESNLNTIHRLLMKKLHHNITVITLSDQGIYFTEGKKGEIIPAHRKDVSDVSGAGDTVIAVATLALASGMKTKDAISLANLAGGLVCEHPGVVPITREMLLSSN